MNASRSALNADTTCVCTAVPRHVLCRPTLRVLPNHLGPWVVRPCLGWRIPCAYAAWPWVGTVHTYIIAGWRPPFFDELHLVGHIPAPHVLAPPWMDLLHLVGHPHLRWGARKHWHYGTPPCLRRMTTDQDPCVWHGSSPLDVQLPCAGYDSDMCWLCLPSVSHPSPASHADTH